LRAAKSRLTELLYLVRVAAKLKHTVPVLVAILLAAGESSRMGSPKALLRDREGDPFVARVARTFLEAGIGHLIIVTGRHHDAVATALPQLEGLVRIVRNDAPERGQLSSLWVGLDAVQPLDPDAVLMTLVDVPFVTADTVRAVVDAWRRTGAPIVRPAIGDRHGHPVLFDRAVLPELRRAPLDEGAKAVVHAHARELVNVAVEDEGAVTDIDTRVDYENAVKRLG
jgi:molybdenum cofactor cytidylyltransferase